MKILTITTLFLACFALASYSQDTTRTIQDSGKSITTVGVINFDVIDNLHQAKKGYSINQYYIALTDLTETQIASLKGKIVTITGKLEINKGITLPPKKNYDGTSVQPIPLTDRWFIAEPKITIVNDSAK